MFELEEKEKKVVRVDGGYITISEYEQYLAYMLGFETGYDRV
mgnify:CR=1 FL=1